MQRCNCGHADRSGNGTGAGQGRAAAVRLVQKLAYSVSSVLARDHHQIAGHGVDSAPA